MVPWSEAENAEIIRLKISGMKWKDISKELRGRSAISCRLHYQNYLKKRGSEKKREWDEKKRNKLVRVSNRLKSEPQKPGRVGQRRRMLKFTQVFEGHDLTPPCSNHEDSCTPRSAHNQRHPFPETSNETLNFQSASPSTKPGHHPHGCFRCEKPGASGTCNGWIRHMKEHEIVFPCRQCEDSDTARNPMLKSDASAQADTWRKTRKYFSCGFCVSLFDNIADQMNHIDTEHFRCLQDISGSAAIRQVIRTEIPQHSDKANVTGGFTNPHMEMDQNMLSGQYRATVTPIRSPSADGCPHGHGPGVPGNIAFTPVNIPPINSYTQENFARDDKGREEEEKLPGFTEFIKGVEDLARRKQ